MKEDKGNKERKEGNKVPPVSERVELKGMVKNF